MTVRDFLISAQKKLDRIVTHRFSWNNNAKLTDNFLSLLQEQGFNFELDKALLMMKMEKNGLQYEVVFPHPSTRTDLTPEVIKQRGNSIDYSQHPADKMAPAQKKLRNAKNLTRLHNRLFDRQVIEEREVERKQSTKMPH